LKNTTEPKVEGEIIEYRPATILVRTGSGEETIKVRFLSDAFLNRHFDKEWEVNPFRGFKEAVSLAEQESAMLKDTLTDGNEVAGVLKTVAGAIRSIGRQMAAVEKENRELKRQLGIAVMPAQAAAAPPAVAARIKAKAARDFPGDFVTQEYIIKSQAESYAELQQYRGTVGGVRSQAEARAARQFSDDFTTQLYVVRSQIGAASRLSAPVAPRKEDAPRDPMKPDQPSLIPRLK
jgi:hypothetical protein